MITVEVSGGLGNQMYKYATAFAAAKESGQSIVIDRTTLDTVDFRDYELDGLKIEKAKEISWGYRAGLLDRLMLNRLRRYRKIGFAKILTETRGVCQYYPEVIEQAKRGKNLYLLGGWQNYRHFEKYQNDLIRMCDINFPLGEKSARLLVSIQQTNSAAVHVRRGDYVKLGFTIDDAYYQRALLALQNNTSDAHLFVFSDDIEFCKKLFQNQPESAITYVVHDDTRTTLVDFYLMRQCKHIIMANSSFSWWAAYTMPHRESPVICPDGGVKDPIRNSLYPKDWMII